MPRDYYALQSRARARLRNKFLDHIPGYRTGEVVYGDAKAVYDTAKRTWNEAFSASRRAINKRRRITKSQPKRSAMPKYRRPNARAVFRRGRRARKTYAKRSSRFRKYRRGARKARRIVPFYPSGLPRTHLVRLRYCRQISMKMYNSEWGFLVWVPNRLAAPLNSFMHDTSATAGTKRIDVAGWTSATPPVKTYTPDRQPLGFDQWLGFASSQYNRYNVVSAKIVMKHIPNTVSDTGTQMYCGWRKTPLGLNQEAVNLCTTVNAKDVGHWLNSGLVKNPKVLTSGRSGGQFVATYSYKKYLKQIKREAVGTLDSDATNVHNLGANGDSIPLSSVEMLFFMGAVGIGTPGDQNFLVTIDYLVQLSEFLPPVQSTF